MALFRGRNQLGLDLLGVVLLAGFSKSGLLGLLLGLPLLPKHYVNDAIHLKAEKGVCWELQESRNPSLAIYSVAGAYHVAKEGG